MTENEAEKLYQGAKEQLADLACRMQLIVHPAHVAQLFLATGLAVLLTFGPEPTRQWLEKAMEGLEGDDPKVH